MVELCFAPRSAARSTASRLSLRIRNRAITDIAKDIAFADAHQSEIISARSSMDSETTNPRQAAQWSLLLRDVLDGSTPMVSVVALYVSCWQRIHRENQPVTSVAQMPSVMLYTANPGMGCFMLSSAMTWPATRGRNSVTWLVQSRPMVWLISWA